MSCFFPRYFRQSVSSKYSTVKIADEVPRDDKAVIDSIIYTTKLEEVFHQNAAEDPLMRFVKTSLMKY